MKKLIDPFKNTFNKPRSAISSFFSKRKPETLQNNFNDFKADSAQMHDPLEESNVKKREILDNILGSSKKLF